MEKLDLADEDHVGVAHYRRHFSTSKKATTLDKAISGAELKGIIANQKGNIIFATPSRTYVESIEDHYIHSLKGYEEIHKKDIERLKKSIHKNSPSYDGAAKKVLEGRTAHMLNMFIMDARNFSAYCEWLFPVINGVVVMSKDREDQRRYAGALSEFCLDIWANAHGVTVKELQLLETEKVSFFKRVVGYIKRKL